ncbi:expressed protein, partial [Aureococcus anophagefferens]
PEPEARDDGAVRHGELRGARGGAPHVPEVPPAPHGAQGQRARRLRDLLRDPVHRADGRDAHALLALRRRGRRRPRHQGVHPRHVQLRAHGPGPAHRARLRPLRRGQVGLPLALGAHGHPPGEPHAVQAGRAQEGRHDHQAGGQGRLRHAEPPGVRGRLPQVPLRALPQAREEGRRGDEDARLGVPAHARVVSVLRV